MKKFSIFVIIFALFFVFGTVFAEDVRFESVRGTEIPAIFTPAQGVSDVAPVVIMAHGHGGNKDEAGLFILIAEELSKVGVATLRLDFPGCGDSSEDFVTMNNMTNMLDDIQSAKSYILTRNDVDSDRLGLFGYSMGGRLAVVTAGSDPDFKALVLLAAAVSPNGENMYTFMQVDEAGYQANYEKAQADDQVTYSAVFGFDQTLGVAWFDGMAEYDALKAASNITIPVLVISGGADMIISEVATQQLIDALSAVATLETFVVEDGDHGFGAYSGQTELTAAVAQQSANFFPTWLN